MWQWKRKLKKRDFSIPRYEHRSIIRIALCPQPPGRKFNVGNKVSIFTFLEVFLILSLAFHNVEKYYIRCEIFKTDCFSSSQRLKQSNSRIRGVLIGLVSPIEGTSMNLKPLGIVWTGSRILEILYSISHTSLSGHMSHIYCWEAWETVASSKLHNASGVVCQTSSQIFEPQIFSLQLKNVWGATLIESLRRD